MMRIERIFVAIAISAGFAVGCSSAPDPPPEDAPPAPLPEFEDEAEDEVHAGEEFRPNIPEYRELSLRDDEPEVVDGQTVDDISSFYVGDLKVIHMPTPANEVVAVRLFFAGGSAMLDDTTAGIERLALSVATNGGTESTPRDEFNARLDAVGSSVSFFAGRDFTGYSMRSVREHFDDTWELFVESVFEPALPADELEIQRDRQLANIRSIVDNPDRLVNEVTRDLTFADHPYQVRELGTEQTVSQFTTDHLRAWQRSMLAPERMLLVVVGNVDREDVEERVRASLGRVQPAGIEVPELPGISPDAAALRVENMDLPTNYILGYYDAPARGHEDYAALTLAKRHLRNRLFEEVRTKRNLTYAVSSGLGDRADNVGFLYVTAVDPEATIPVIMTEVERLQNEPIDETDLEEVRNVFLTSHYQDLETNARIAGQLARAQLFTGDWTTSQTFLDQIMAVTTEDLQRVAQQYLHTFQFGVVGNPDDVPPQLFGIDTDDAETVDEFEDIDPADIEEAQQPEPEAPTM